MTHNLEYISYSDNDRLAMLENRAAELERRIAQATPSGGLPDLVPWPDGEIKHVVVCHVPAGKGEPAHEHADLRYFMATGEPDAARPENPEAPLRWLTLPDARDLVGTNNLRHTLDRAAALLAVPGGLAE